ncbi:hypothetical protein EB796_014534 [Bugula neritina]|uniref:Uncharacterized protein n=1 Tax=Bugula neritina TaxID=10212 RepID=A0A7J7JP32_BUGNE|nr:hypothetical protein EB796_014534 [Bugula neritina]
MLYRSPDYIIIYTSPYDIRVYLYNMMFHYACLQIMRFCMYFFNAKKCSQYIIIFLDVIYNDAISIFHVVLFLRLGFYTLLFLQRNHFYIS